MTTANSSIIYGVVPAAGVGSRMQSTTAKQYLSVAGSTVIEHTLHRLINLECLHSVTLAVAQQDSVWPTLGVANHPKIQSVIGGNTRADSVLAALDYLIATHSSQNAWALVHDAARPCVSLNNIEQLIQKAMVSADGGLLGLPITDTIKRVNADRVSATVSREHLYVAQTPQLFPLAELHQALTLAKEQGIQVTDECSAMEAQGWQPLMVLGHRDNLKLTYPGDLHRITELLT